MRILIAAVGGMVALASVPVGYGPGALVGAGVVAWALAPTFARAL